MKNKVLTVIVVAVLLCLSGCYPERKMYTQEDADRVTEKGTEMMLDWLDEHMPDAQLDRCAAYITNSGYDRDEYLTDYASGQISQNGMQKNFTIHTVSGAVYFEVDADTKQELDALVESYFHEALASSGIIPESKEEGYVFSCYVMAPPSDGGSSTVFPNVYSFDFGLPAGVEDLEAFVREPQSRLPIYVSSPSLWVSDETDLSAYDLAALEALEAEYGLHIGSLCIENSFQTLQKSSRFNEIQVKLWEYGNWYEADGIVLYGMLHDRYEVRNRDTDTVTVSDIVYRPETDLVFEETDYGYRCVILNESCPAGFSLSLIADQDAEIRGSDYYNLSEEAYLRDKTPRDDWTETVWLEMDDGSCILASAEAHHTGLLHDGDVLIRIE